MSNTVKDVEEKLLYERYRVLGELGRGGFGVTFLAEDTKCNNSQCVIKRLNSEYAEVETAKRLFHREARILESLENSHQIPKFLDFFQTDNSYYLVEEFIDGIPLNKMLGGKWARKDVINFLRQILSILNFIHQQQIIHRDIKPSNIIQKTTDRKFVLIDFGAVKKLENNQHASLTQQGMQTKIITQGYSPPEQAEGNVWFCSDIYSLGVTAIQLLTGMHPTTLRRDQNDNVILPDVDTWLASILKKMVYYQPEERYQYVSEVISDLTREETSPLIQQNLRSTQVAGMNSQMNTVDGNSNSFLKNRKPIPLALSAVAIIVGLTSTIELINPFIRPLYHLNKGNELLDKSQPDAALKEFDQLVKIQPYSVQGWQGRGDALLSLGRDLKALQFYNHAISLQPKDIKVLSKIYINKGKIEYNQGNYKEALSTYERVIDLNPNNPEGWSGKGLALIGLGKSQEASEAFATLKSKNPEEPRIWQEIGFAVEISKGQSEAKRYFEEALESYHDLISSQPNNVIALTDRGSVFLKLRRPQEALDSFNQALAVDKNFYEALLGKGNTLDILGKPQEALSAFDEAIKVRSDDYQVWVNRGWLLLQKIKNPKEALISFNRAIQARETFHPAWLGKGLSLLDIEDDSSKKERQQEALAAFDKAKELNDKDPYVWANRARILKELGKTQEARDSEQKARELGLPPGAIDGMQ